MTENSTSVTENADENKLNNISDAKIEKKELNREKETTQEQLDQEKKDFLLLFHEHEQRGYRISRKFTMKSDINEIRFWYTKLTRGIVISKLREYIRDGLKMDESINFETSPYHDLCIEEMRLKDLQFKRDMMKSAFQIFGFLAEKYIDFKKIATEMIRCAQCDVENCIEIQTKLILDYPNNCLKCNDRKAQIYHPQCGHISLCDECFKSIIRVRLEEIGCHFEKKEQKK